MKKALGLLLLAVACGPAPNTLEIGEEQFDLQAAGPFIPGYGLWELRARPEPILPAPDPGQARVVVSNKGTRRADSPWVQVAWLECSNREESLELNGSFDVDLDAAFEMEDGRPTRIREQGRVVMSGSGDVWCGEARERRPYAFAVDHSFSTRPRSP